ncbi:MAG: hypothetical protein AVDCRST_MAG54-1949 [uncultured Actinomycetospora sp.]|uniref:Uncharacterized protein n=1 Tax=uncultured Actinomycetospora sp. TaxID=1135996 RepID=A0A6J4IH59_9PSEU|nr:MAG: hypothetical protein AVDCRST_MAG54-1949 [uncultured Actinomycetospora sp.]
MPAIPDEHVVRVLRPFVAATGPVLRGLRDADPFRLGRLARRRAIELQESGGGELEPVATSTSRRARIGRGLRAARARLLDRLATSRLPGTPRWQAMSPEERDDWWVSRVGRFTSAVASVPGLGGALARRLPVSDILGLGAQGLVVCAIASEHGLDGRDEQVRLLASVLFGREVDPASLGDPHHDDVEREAGELRGTVGSADHHEERGRLAALARAIWRMGRTLWGLQEELGRRPQGRRFWRVLANVPVVGALASYRSERSGLKRAARAAAQWVAREQGRAR